MANLKKADLTAAQDEIHEKIGFDPKPNKKDKLDVYEKNLYQSILDIELDDEDRMDLSEATLVTINALAEKYPKMKVSPDEDGEETEVEDAEVVDEKPAKKGKKEKSAKKEKEVKEEKPAKAKKEKKAKDAPVEEPKAEKKAAKPEKKGKKSKGGNAELIEQINTAPYKELKNIVKDNEVFAGFPVVGLSNEMYRSELIAVLNGEKTAEEVKEAALAARAAGKEKAAKEPKKEKKAKAAKTPTLTEQVEAAEDLDALKAIAKANKDAFPGVKAKKFDKVKKLRKAMLEVIVEPKAEKSGKKKSGNRLSSDESRKIHESIIGFCEKLLDKNNGRMDRKELTEAALAKFPEHAKKVRDDISYGTNEKYNKFKELLVKGDDGSIGYASTAAKPSKKAKKAKEAPAKAEKSEKAAKAEKPAKEKKNKKDKKKGKKGKK